MRPLLPSLARLLLLGTLPLLALSCKKTTEAPTDADAPETEIASAATTADITADDLGAITDEAAATGRLTGYSGGSTGYPRLTVRNRVAANPDTLLVDFGPTNLTGPYGRQRRGQLVIVYAAPFGSGPVTTTPNGYFVNDNQVTGSRVATRTGSGQVSVAASFTIALAGGGGTVAYVANRTREQVAGAGTPTPDDDVYVLNGSATFTGPRGVEYSSVAANLRLPLSCGHYVSGTLTLTRRQDASRGVRLDFGSGNCDNTAQATLLASGRTFPVTLR